MAPSAVSAAPTAILSEAMLSPEAFAAFPALPALGNIEAYITAIQKMPMLQPEQEQQLARALRDHEDVNAAHQMVLSHLRLVVSVVRQYAGYGMPMADLIQEGNIGLMKAVRRFDPEKGVRLVSYAMHWIKAEISEYIVKNWRIVRLATTKSQRKIFFNLRSMRQKMHELSDDATNGIHHGASALTSQQVKSIAAEINVDESDVREMEVRMGGGDFSMESDDEGDVQTAPIHSLGGDWDEPTRTLARRSRERMSTTGVLEALEVLDERSRYIVEQRWLNVNDEGQGLTLHDLAKIYSISAERVRQIEGKAMVKMREHLTRTAEMV